MCTMILATNINPASAQQPPFCVRGNCSGNPSPIGGIAILAIAGGGYALKKLYDKNKE